MGDQVGHVHLSDVPRMDKEVVVSLKEEHYVADLLASFVTLLVPSTQVSISDVPSFIPKEVLEQELHRSGEMASGLRKVGLGCRPRAVILATASCS